MKKLTAVLVVFVLVAAMAASLDFSMTGYLSTGVTLLGNSANQGLGVFSQATGYKPIEENDLVATLFRYGAEISVNANNANNNAGMGIGFNYYPGEDYPSAGANFWWSPIPALLIRLKSDYGFHGPLWANWGLNANNSHIRPQFWWTNGYAGAVLPATAGFYEGYGYSGLPVVISFNPSLIWPGNSTGELTFVLGLSALGGMDGWTASNLGVSPADGLKTSWENLHAQASYNIYDKGRMTFFFANTSSLDIRKAQEYSLQWDQMIKAASMEFGVTYRALKDKWPDNGQAMANKPIDYLYPLRVGISYNKGNPWGAETLITNARLGVSIPLSGPRPESEKTFNHLLAEIYYPIVGADLVLFITVAKSMRLYLPLGIGTIITGAGTLDKGGKEVPLLLGWAFSPYIIKKIERVDLSAGLRLYNGNADVPWDSNRSGPTLSLNPENMKIIRWAIPISINWEF